MLAQNNPTPQQTRLLDIVNKHSLETSINFPVSIYPKAENRELWEAQKSRLNLCVEKAESILNEPWPNLTASDYLEYSKSGNRSKFELKYFKRRDSLVALVLAECSALIILEEDSFLYMEHQAVTQSEAETELFAANFARSTQVGSIIALHGNLGAGKTVFSRGFFLKQIPSAPRKLDVILQGESPCRARLSQPPVPSVAVPEEWHQLRTMGLKRTQGNSWATGWIIPPEDKLASLSYNTTGDAFRNAESNTKDSRWRESEGVVGVRSRGT